MRQITKQYTIYNYNDILQNQALKDTILKKHYDINVDFDDWYESELDYWTEQLEATGFLNPKIYFTGFYSQGDGACFEISGCNFELLLKDFEIPHKKWIISFLQDYCTGNIYKNSYGYHYEHEKTRYFEISNNCPFNYSRIEAAVQKASNYIEALRYELSCKIYSDLEDTYNYLTSEEAILETIQANEYEFDENGDIAA